MGNAYDYSVILSQGRPSDIVVPDIAPVVAHYNSIYHHKAMIVWSTATVLIEYETVNDKQLLRLRYSYMDMLRNIIVSIRIRDLGGGLAELKISVENKNMLQYYNARIVPAQHINKIIQNLEKVKQ